RFLHGYAIERGESQLNLGPLSIPTWGTRIAEPGIAHPQELMQLSGWLVIPGIVWLLLVLLSNLPGASPAEPETGQPHDLPRGPAPGQLSRDASSSKRGFAAGAGGVVAPSILIFLAAVCVLGARQLVAWPPEDFWGGASWARTWRIMAVFASLGGLMMSLAWFGQRTMKIAGPQAIPPLLLTSTAAILWLLGQTPLGQTLVPAPFLFL